MDIVFTEWAFEASLLSLTIKDIFNSFSKEFDQTAKSIKL